MSETTCKVITHCPFCGESGVVEVPAEGYIKYSNGAHVQDAFPLLPVDVREQLISGLCPKCQERVFGTSEDDDEEENEDTGK